MRALLEYYLCVMKQAIIVQFQYRIANYFSMVGLVAEPVVYLVVWSSIARSNGGSVAGRTPGDFAAYYIVWTLVRNMNIVFTPYGWEMRVQYGQLSEMLLKPIHPIHYDLAYFAGWKIVVIFLWLPLAFILSSIFHPVLHPTLLQIGVFSVAIWGAFLIRSMMLWLLGMVTFWTTRVSAFYEFFFAVELILSGRLVPLALLPPWARRLAAVLPFEWAFGLPIEILVGQPTPERLVAGLGMQVLWISAGAAAVALVWHRGIRRYTGVGG